MKETELLGKLMPGHPDIRPIIENIRARYSIPPVDPEDDIDEILLTRDDIDWDAVKQDIDAQVKNVQLFDEKQTTYLQTLQKLTSAQTFSRQLVRMGEDSGARTAWCWGETTLGYILNRQGKLDEAIAHLQQAVALAETVPDHIFRLYAGTELGLCYLRQGDINRACTEFEACLRVRHKHQILDIPGYLLILNDLAETCLYAATQSEGSQRIDWLNKAQSNLRTSL